MSVDGYRLPSGDPYACLRPIQLKKNNMLIEVYTSLQVNKVSVCN